MDNKLSDILALASLPEKVSRVIHRAETVVNSQEVDAAIDRQAVLLTALAQDRNPVLLTLIPGGGYLSGVLLRRTIFPLQTSYAYWHEANGQAPCWAFAGGSPELNDRLVIVIDGGLTSKVELEVLGEWLQEAGAAEGWQCSMVAGPDTSVNTGAFFTRRLFAITAELEGLFGCGLDVHGYCRNLPSLFRA